MTDDQLPLLGPRGGLKPKVPGSDKESGDFARVLVDSPLPHLDRTFDYAIPARLSGTALPGVRVRVPLAGTQHDGYILSRSSATDHEGRVLPLREVVSPVAVLPEGLAGLCRQVADHYAGSMSDVVRLAVPPRVAACESEAVPAPPTPTASPGPASNLPGPLTPSSQGASLLQALSKSSRAAWACPPGTDWETGLAEVLAGTVAGGGRALAVLPDRRDVDRLARAVADLVGPDRLATLRADLGPKARYAQYLSVLGGEPSIVIGTRAAAFAPVPDLRLAVIWDDGDASHREQRAPYPHARDVLALRSHQASTAFLCAGFVQTPEVQRWVETGWMVQVPGDRETVRALRPRITTAEDNDRSPFDSVTRIPASALAALRQGLESGPVLVQVARRGYIPTTACATCREIAACPQCGGALSIETEPSTMGARSPRASQVERIGCRRCGRAQPGWTCPHCGGQNLRAVSFGAGRTAHELGRLLTGVRVQISTADHPVERITDEPQVVVATSGVEPSVMGGYRAGFFPDAQSELWRVGATARQDAARRWMNAAALLAPGAPLLVAADPSDPLVQAVIRWDPVALAEMELRERAELRLPPAIRLVRVDGVAPDVEALVGSVQSVPNLQVLGPMPEPDDPGRVRVALTSESGRGLVGAVRQAVVSRAASRAGKPVRVQVDATDLDS